MKLETIFRTRRIIRLPESHNADTRYTSESKPIWRTFTLACKALGIPDTRDWMVLEIEALERFWMSKNEWEHHLWAYKPRTI